MDVISRKAAIEFVKEQMVKETGAYSKGRNVALNIISSALNNPDAIPSVDAAPVVHGRWIGWNYPGDEHIKCSICKQQYYEDDLYIGGNDFPKYCPNCGAKMDLEGENDG